MNSVDRIRACLRFGQTDRPPLAPEMVAVTATLHGAPVIDYVKSGRTIAECQLAAQEMLGSDAVFAISDLCVEAEAVGCKIHFPNDNYPHIAEPVINDFSDFKKLGIPDPHSDGRMPEIIEASKIIKHETGERIPVFSNVVGPITLASRIMNLEKMLYMIVDYPEKFQAIIDYCLDVTTTFAEAQINEGVDGIMVFDPTASPAILPANIFSQFEAQAVNALIYNVKRINPDAIIWYSVAGPVQSNFSIITDVNADITTVDYFAPIDVVMKYSNYSVINGNIKPSLFLEGNEDDIYKEARSLLAKTRGQERFILGSGCEAPLHSKVENILALRRAVDDEIEYFESVNEPYENAHELKILPHRKKVYVDSGANIFDAALLAGAPITGSCDNTGSCGKCGVVVESGEFNDPDEMELNLLDENEGGNSHRLACLAKISGPSRIYLPHTSRYGISPGDTPEALFENSVAEQVEKYGFSPNIETHMLDLSDLTHTPNMTYGDWLAGMFGGMQINSRAVNNFVTYVNDGATELYAVTDLKRNEIIDFSKSAKIYGMAIEISALTISAYAHNFSDGRLQCACSIENPLTSLKRDILRDTNSDFSDPVSLTKFQAELVEGINRLIVLCHENHSINQDRVYELTVVANPIFTHLLLGLDPRSNPHEHIKPAKSESVSTSAQALGSKTSIVANPLCRVEILPSVGWLVGADAIAGAFTTMPLGQKGPSLFISIGSVGHIMLSDNERSRWTHVDTGAIFEAPKLNQANVCHNGLIYKSDIDPSGKVCFETFGGVSPFGISGSALISIIADLMQHEIINSDGLFINPGKWNQVVSETFVLVAKQNTATFNPICVTSTDIKEAMEAIVEYRAAIIGLLTRCNVDISEIRHVSISGPLGVLINEENALLTGLIPKFPNASVSIHKNAPGSGARVAMLSRGARNLTEQIANISELVGGV